MPVAQDGLQSSIFSVPVPTASVEFHVGQVMFHSEVVPSPDSGQPAAQADAWIAVPFVSPPSAKYVTGCVGVTLMTGLSEGDAGVTGAWETDAEISPDGLAWLGGADAAVAAAAPAVVVLAAAPTVPELELWQPAVSRTRAAASAAAGARARVE